MRLLYPPPRSDENGIKNGPCGAESDDFTGSYTVLQPGEIITVIISEYIHHPGAPYRLSLSYENIDYGYDSCILLDHIPQHNYNQIANELHINIKIPNVYCNLCSIQALSIMTDKIDNNTCCNYKNDGVSGSCSSNYHSCANVFINGTVNRNKLLCKVHDDVIPPDWPFRNWKTNRYTQESTDIYWNDISNASTNELILELDYQSDVVLGGNLEAEVNIEFVPDPCDDYTVETVDDTIDKHVLLIGIDGFGGMYMENATSFLPNINSLILNGIHSFRGRNMLPTVSGPNWGTIITGLTPAQSGISDINLWNPLFTNSSVYMPPITGSNMNPPTIFDILEEEFGDKIITAASTHWIWYNYLLQNINDNKNDSKLDFYYQINSDKTMTESMVYYIREYQPNFMYICFDEVDDAGHSTYWGSDSYYTKTKEIDAYIGQIIDALTEMNIIDDTLIIITADHGGFGSNHYSSDCSSQFSSQPIQYIPAIFNGKNLGFKVNETISTYFQHNDFVPTILDYFGVDVEKYNYMRGKIQTDLYTNYEENNKKNDDHKDTEILILRIVAGILVLIIIALLTRFYMNRNKLKDVKQELQLIHPRDEMQTLNAE